MVSSASKTGVLRFAMAWWCVRTIVGVGRKVSWQWVTPSIIIVCVHNYITLLYSNTRRSPSTHSNSKSFCARPSCSCNWRVLVHALYCSGDVQIFDTPRTTWISISLTVNANIITIIYRPECRSIYFYCIYVWWILGNHLIEIHHQDKIQIFPRSSPHKIPHWLWISWK